MLVCVTGIKGSGKTTTMQMIAKCGFNTFIMDK
jgi:dephospho-CoA kinase